MPSGATAKRAMAGGAAPLAVIALAASLGGCAVNSLGADVKVYDGGGMVMLERRTFGAHLQTDRGLAFSLGAETSRIGVSEGAYRACNAAPGCAFSSISETIFLHRSVTGLDIQMHNPVFGVTFGKNSTFSFDKPRIDLEDVRIVAYDQEDPDGFRGCIGWESCAEFPWRSPSAR